MQRYLIFFGYSGTRFSGLQKLHKRVPPELMTPEYFKKDEDSVQGALEAAIYCNLKPANPVNLYTSSRTDTGVHAIANTGHVDLQSSIKGFYFDPKVITGLLNLYLRERCLDITVMRTLGVPGWFSARHDAVNRTYLYRIAVPKNKVNMDELDGDNYHRPVTSRSKIRQNRKKRLKKLREVYDFKKGFAFCPITPILAAVDQDKILELRESIDPELFEAALSQMVGTHNFASFCNAQGFYEHIKTKEGEHKIEKRDITSLTKTIESIEVTKLTPWMPSSVDCNYDSLDFYNVVIRGRSFLHNQVRRMVGIALGVASGKLQPETVSELLSNPSTVEKFNYPGTARPAPPHGLYLANIGYDRSLDLATEDVRKLPLPPSLCPRDDFDWVLGPGFIENGSTDSSEDKQVTSNTFLA